MADSTGKLFAENLAPESQAQAKASDGAAACKPLGPRFFTDVSCHEFASESICQERRQAMTWLASYPGSGSTWTRLMLEQTTGIYTGAVYNDPALLAAGFKGEGHTSADRVLGVKNHYPAHDAPHIDGGRALVVLRRPLNAALAWTSYQAGDGDHGTEIDFTSLRSRFDSRRDEMLAAWKRHYLHFKNNFSGIKQSIKFEDIKANTTKAYLDVILPFLGINSDSPTIQQRLACAVEVSNTNAETRRSHAYVFQFSPEDEAQVRNIIGCNILEDAGYPCTGS
mmetsp:Transcript_55845/g.158578  ORF Transcript_55845/g.158578 Transcript_55845/m.158578 type:complete len:281 (-) Transcript_55845:69-911(-)